ncbi:hypothetical protein LOK74_13450 [Brevibacillus humidisoli]|uniref:hypothetical protein n=1 Tax=Brevibacillus humidisoli TaxID=2895522 RepID=UPI001E3981DB|nr:hypothetical protein [Brevibacillus humidisoli]UFJ39081.1 hypothetical protein LOK74_13450 [Brevibacillus humidisoli]
MTSEEESIIENLGAAKKIVSVVIASIISIMTWGMQFSFYLPLLFVYSFVVVNCFLIFSLPISLMTDYITQSFKRVGWLFSGLFQVGLTLVVIFPLCLLFYFAVGSFDPWELQGLSDLLSQYRIILLSILFNAALFCPST